MSEIDDELRASHASSGWAARGLAGLATAADAFSYGDDNSGYWIGDAITGLRLEGFPVGEAVNDLLQAADSPGAREAAEELANYLNVERR